jgi:hypothetical protein
MMQYKCAVAALALVSIQMAPASDTDRVVEGEILLMETFRSVVGLPTADWAVVSQDGTHEPEVSETAGNSAKCLAIGGGFSSEQCGVYLDTHEFTYAGERLLLQLDAWLTGDGCHFTDIKYGLADPSDPNDSPLVRMWFNKNCPNLRNVTMGIFSDNPDHQEQVTIAGAYTSDAWNTGKIVIREDLKVEFYVNERLLWTTTKTIDVSLDGLAKFFVVGHEGGGPAYADNIIIAYSSSPFCAGDIVGPTRDGIVDVQDFLKILEWWGPCP